MPVIPRESQGTAAGCYCTELEVLKQQLDNLEKDHQKQMKALQTKMEETELKATTTTTVSKPVTNYLKQVLRMDFKINSQIGEPGQKDKLTLIL